MKKKILFILLFVCMLIVVSTKTYNYKKYKIKECELLKNGLFTVLGEMNFDVTYSPEYNEITIYVPSASGDDTILTLEKMTNYIDGCMHDENFIINVMKCDYIIWCSNGNHLPGPVVTLGSYGQALGNEGNYRYGAYMEIHALYDRKMYEGTEFSNVKYLLATGVGDPLKDITLVEHFPNLEYLNLCYRETTQGEFEYLKRVLPENCVIDKYIIVE